MTTRDSSSAHNWAAVFISVATLGLDLSIGLNMSGSGVGENWDSELPIPCAEDGSRERGLSIGDPVETQGHGSDE
jgi:hypothetical protein